MHKYEKIQFYPRRRQLFNVIEYKKKKKKRELIEFVARTKPIVQNYRPKGGLFEYYGRKTKDGAVMSPTLVAGTRVSISSARARPMAHQRYPCEEEKKKKRKESRCANDLSEKEDKKKKKKRHPTRINFQPRNLPLIT